MNLKKDLFKWCFMISLRYWIYKLFEIKFKTAVSFYFLIFISVYKSDRKAWLEKLFQKLKNVFS